MGKTADGLLIIALIVVLVGVWPQRHESKGTSSLSTIAEAAEPATQPCEKSDERDLLEDYQLLHHSALRISGVTAAALMNMHQSDQPAEAHVRKAYMLLHDTALRISITTANAWAQMYQICSSKKESAR